jgi:DNA-binding response OmpR family regulator
MSKVMILDRDNSIRELLRLEFQEEGHEVAVLDPTVVRTEDLSHVRPDVIVLDPCSPGNRQVPTEFLEEVGSKFGQVPIVIFCGSCPFSQRHGSIPVEGCVTKTGDLTQLKETVSELLRRQGNSQSAL